MLSRLSRRLLFPSVPATTAGKGSFITMGGKYYEVEKIEAKHVARQAGFIKIEAVEILSGKKEHMQLSSNGKIDKVETTRVTTQVQYIDKPTNMVVLADEEFNTIEVSMDHCSHVAAFLEPGTQIMVFKDTETGDVVKCTFPSSVLMKARGVAR